jgi:hypothetical protein
VCKDWAFLVESDQIWKKQFKRQFGKLEEPGTSQEAQVYVAPKKQQDETWMDYYWRNMRMKFPYRFRGYRPVHEGNL